MRKNRGQALPIGIALLLVLCVVATVLFNTGQSVSEKTRVANAADAASYSGLLWQSRALNFLAYTNRAMVANQVAMAQAVSINSWASYAEITVSNLDKYLKAIPYVGAVVSVVKTVVSGVEAFISPISEAMLSTVNSINGVLSGAQQAMYLASFAATPEVVSNVVNANDKRFEWQTGFSMFELGKNLASWNSFTAKVTSSDKAHMEERVNIIEASLDTFSRDRNWDFFKQWIPTSPLTSVRVEKRGETRLIRSKDGKNYEWKAKDNVSLNTKVFRFWKKSKIIELPIGYAEAYARHKGSGSSIEPCTGYTLCKDWFGSNTTAQSMAQNFNSNDISSHFSGIRAFRVLSDSVREGEQLATLKLRVEVALPHHKFSSNLAKQSNRVFSPVSLPGQKLTSISAAELFYERPDEIYSQHKENKEYATAYNPFWDVKLADISKSTKLALYALRTKAGMASQPKLALLDVGQAATPLSDYESQGAMLPFSQRQALVQKINNLAGSSVSNSIALAMSLTSFDDVLSQLDSIGLNEESRVETILAKYGDFSSLSSVIENQVKNALKQVLNSAVKNILAGMVGKLGVNSKLATDMIANEAKGQFDALLNEQDAFSLEQGIAHASQKIDELSHKLQVIRGTVIDRFAKAVEDSAIETVKIIHALNEERDKIRDELKSTLNDEHSTILENSLYELSRDIENVREKRIDKLAERLQRIVSDLMPDYPLSFADARRAVVTSLEVKGSSISDLLNIIEIADANGSH